MVSAPTTSSDSVLKYSLTYFPNQDELLFLTVFALPNASRIGLQSRILSSIVTYFYSSFASRSSPLANEVILVRNFIAYLALTVFPAPDSPDITIACFILFSFNYLNAELETENI